MLLVEDEIAIAAIIKKGLQEEGFLVESVRDGRRGLDHALHNDYACVILDLMLPEMDGLKVCETLRQRKKNVPILMLTARGEVEDRVTGLNLGADDYLAKPFDFAELIARVHALVRRDSLHKGDFLTIGRLTINTTDQTVSCNGKPLQLTRQEYGLLLALARQEGRAISRDYITQVVWGADDTYSNSVDVHIAQLRKKIDAGYQQKLIHTVHRVGYQLKQADVDS